MASHLCDAIASPCAGSRRDAAPVGRQRNTASVQVLFGSPWLIASARRTDIRRPRRLSGPAPTAPLRCPPHRSPASPGDRSRARCRRKGAGRVRGRRGNPRRSGRSRRRAPVSSPGRRRSRRRCSAGIGQLAKGVGEFEPTDINLEALGKARVGRAAARQRRHRQRIVVKDRRRPEAEKGLDPLEEDAEIERLPIVSGVGVDPEMTRRSRKAFDVGCSGSGAVARRSTPQSSRNASAMLIRCHGRRASAVRPRRTSASAPAACWQARTQRRALAIRSR